MNLLWSLAIIALRSAVHPLAPHVTAARRCGRAPATAARAVFAEDTTSSSSEANLLGRVVSTGSLEGLVVVRPESRELARVGSLLSFGGGTTGVILAERCGLYFAKATDGMPQVDEPATLLLRNLTVATHDADASVAWGGVYNYLGEPLREQDGVPRPPTSMVTVFDEPVSAARRRPIGTSLHSGVVAIDALTPIGRGQSMVVFGPDGLPAGCGRTDLALRLLSAQHALKTNVKCILVLAGSEGERTSALTALHESGALENTKVLAATTALEGIVAASAACSIAQSCEDEDVLVVVDSLRPHLQLWKTMVTQLQVQSVPVTPEEEGSQQRGYYAKLVERAARRKDGGSVTLVLLQPSVSMLPSLAAVAKEAYTLADFEEVGFTNAVRSRVKLLEAKGIQLTKEVLVKVGIPLPGSEHPAAGRGQRSAQHLEELTSLVDGHIDLREGLAAVGRVPPIDPANSLTRIGVGSSKLRPLSQSAAMADVCGPLRLELASASDYVHCEVAQARRASAYLAVLQQTELQPLPLGDEVALLHAASTGALDEPVALAGEAGAPELLRGLRAHLLAKEPELLSRISQSGLLGDAASRRLGERTAEYLEEASKASQAAR
mgnify:CR=1 FL=1